MHRRVVPVCLALLAALAVAPRAQAQRAEPPAIPALDEPRPLPVFPALLVPFSIPSEYCRDGRMPRVTLRVFSGLTQPIATLVLRGRQPTPIDGRPLRCGDAVARWDGVAGDPPRLVTNAVYWIQLAVDTSAVGASRPPILRTRQLVVPAY